MGHLLQIFSFDMNLHELSKIKFYLLCTQAPTTQTTTARPTTQAPTTTTPQTTTTTSGGVTCVRVYLSILNTQVVLYCLDSITLFDCKAGFLYDVRI